MTPDELQEQCELGQQQLMRMEYLEAEATLVAAEKAALSLEDWDALARLYMPLQETRRQRRQRCGEGTVWLDVAANGPGDSFVPGAFAASYPQGQFLVAGWGTMDWAVRLRSRQAER